jgi:anti-sigma B factor antagonist
MIEQNSGIQVGPDGDVILVQVEGKGTHLNSHLLKQYLLQCLEKKRRLFQIDLSRCTYMDSTFLGMLAGLGIKTEQRSLPKIKLLNPTERIKGMLESLGIDQLFQFCDEERKASPLSQLQGKEISKEEKSREILESHEKLVQAAPSNEAKFRDVITLLRQEVKKTGPT